MLKQEFRERLIARSWQASHCYIKCDNYPVNELESARMNGRNDICGGKKAKTDWRYCRDDDPRTCQIQCWTSKSADNEETFIHGREVLPEKFNMTMADVFDKSLRAWDAGPGTIWSDNYTPPNTTSDFDDKASQLLGISSF